MSMDHYSRTVPELPGTGVREIIEGRYRIVYRIRAKGIQFSPCSKAIASSPRVMWASRRLCSGLLARIRGARVEALQRNQAFIDRYREARADHLAGRQALFPPAPGGCIASPV